jgi:hypothetical protein
MLANLLLIVCRAVSTPIAIPDPPCLLPPSRQRWRRMQGQPYAAERMGGPPIGQHCRPLYLSQHPAPPSHEDLLRRKPRAGARGRERITP